MTAPLTCDDFIYSGFWHAEQCCPYCHEEDQYLYESDAGMKSPTKNTQALLCCTGKKIVRELTRQDWAKVLWDRRKFIKTGKYDFTS
jgi:hypothetical protein